MAAFRPARRRHSLWFMQGGAMETRDGKWRVEVGGVGSVTWYRLIGGGVKRNLPSLAALMTALAEVGVDMGELDEIEPAA